MLQTEEFGGTGAPQHAEVGVLTTSALHLHEPAEWVPVFLAKFGDGNLG